MSPSSPWDFAGHVVLSHPFRYLQSSIGVCLRVVSTEHSKFLLALALNLMHGMTSRLKNTKIAESRSWSSPPFDPYKAVLGQDQAPGTCRISRCYNNARHVVRESSRSDPGTPEMITFTGMHIRYMAHDACSRELHFQAASSDEKRGENRSFVVLSESISRSVRTCLPFSSTSHSRGVIGVCLRPEP